MDIIQRHDGKFVIRHRGREIDEVFGSAMDADRWADEFIDDQVFDTPNDFSPPLKYRDPPSLSVVRSDNSPDQVG